MNEQKAFLSVTGAGYFLQESDPGGIEAYLRQKGWLESGERLRSVEKAGQGNMNRVVRVITDRRSFILKQSRPWVEKFPQIAAPAARILVEARFYELTGRISWLRELMPGLLGKDTGNFLLMLEDLGRGADFTFLYRRASQMPAPLTGKLMLFLSRLHACPFSDDTRESFPGNFAMRRLNHQHLFVFPFAADNGFDLDQVMPGLQAAALPFRRDQALKERLRPLGEPYLGEGPSLLHGDFFPGSWLQAGRDVRIIDPEFCFFGPPEYDLGVMTAHLMMARVPETDVAQARKAYSPLPGFDESLREAFTGMEIMRRLIGLAQLPIDLDLEKRRALLEKARSLIG